MAKVIVDDAELVIQLTAIEKLAAFRGDLRLPARRIESVSVDPAPWCSLRGTRAPGTGLPGVVAYGVRRMTGGKKDFVAVTGRRPALRIEMDSQCSFGRLLVTVADPEATVTTVRAAAGL